MRLTRTPLHARLIATLVAVMTVEALAFETWPVVAVAAALSLLDGVARPSPLASLARLVSSAQYPRRPDAPARRASLLRGGALVIAAAFLAAGTEVAGAVIAGIVALDAALDALLGWCPSGRIDSLLTRPSTQAFDLSGSGPWLVAVSARECELCERVVEVLIEKANEPVTRVVLEERARAAALVRVVPTVLRVGAEGAVTARLGGPRTPEQIERFLGRSSGDSEAADR